MLEHIIFKTKPVFLLPKSFCQVDKIYKNEDSDRDEMAKDLMFMSNFSLESTKAVVQQTISRQEKI